MKKRWLTGFFAAALLAGPYAVSASAQITRVELDVVESPALDGRSFGEVGQFERLRGIAFGEVDPLDPLNAGIVNLDRAPRNERGLVEYSTIVEIHRPTDLSAWNGALYHTVPNRGRATPGDDVLLEMGFATVQVGWQGDLEPTPTNVVPFLPIAREPDGRSITGTAVEEFIFNDPDDVSTASLTYPAANLDPGGATLTVRRVQDDPRVTPADLAWSYIDPQRIRIERPNGYDGGAIYEFVYTARDPIVMGLGFAAVRDVISFLRYDSADDFGNLNPLAASRLPEIAISIGVSQSGRFLRDLLYQGFNEDVEGRIVFDGMHPDIAGSRKTFTNYPFSQPGRWQKQHEDRIYPGDQFPFTYGVLADPISGRSDGLLARCSASDTCPLIVHTDGEAEIWQARASLVVTDPAGEHIELPENVRVYLIAGTQHGGGAGVHAGEPAFGICQNLSNPMALSQIRRAITVAHYEWLAEGKAPPPSRFPTVHDGGLVRADVVAFPTIPGVDFTGSFNPLRHRERWTVPPVEGAEYTVLVGRTDADGNMVGGVRHPNLQAPIGTYTGWNLRREGF
ncbi:MAG: alpha/beta hydrolase domain-containing protein, partial [Gemmatimonadota bacterium]